MKSSLITDAVILRNADKGGEPQSLGQWLKKYRTELQLMDQNQQLDWERLAADLTTQGLLKGKGRVVSVSTLRRAWNRLKKRTTATMPTAVPAERAPRPTPPSRLSGEWHPPVVTRQVEPERPSGIPVAPSPPMIVGEASSEPQRTVADMTPRESMQEALREMDRRANRRVGIR